MRRTPTEKAPVPAGASHPRTERGLPPLEATPPDVLRTNPAYTIDLHEAVTVSVLFFLEVSRWGCLDVFATREVREEASGVGSSKAGEAEAAPETPALAPAPEDDEVGASPFSCRDCGKLPVVGVNGGMGLVSKTCREREN